MCYYYQTVIKKTLKIFIIILIFTCMLTYCRSKSYTLVSNKSVEIFINGKSFIINFYSGKGFLPGKRFLSFLKTNSLNGTYFHFAEKDFFIHGGDLLTKDNDPANDGTGGNIFFSKYIPDIKIKPGTVCYAGFGNGRFSENQFIIFLRELTAQEKEKFGNYCFVFGNIVKGVALLKELSSYNRNSLYKYKITKIKIVDK